MSAKEWQMTFGGFSHARNLVGMFFKFPKFIDSFLYFLFLVDEEYRQFGCVVI